MTDSRYMSIVTVCAFAACACGGAVASPRIEVDGASGGTQESPCVDAGGLVVCPGSIGAGASGSSGMGLKTVDASDDIVFSGGVLCGLNTGPLAPGQDAGGPVMRCMPGLTCVNLDENWACCTPEGSGGLVNCLPFWTDGGIFL